MNLRPPACKAGALPTELSALICNCNLMKSPFRCQVEYRFEFRLPAAGRDFVLRICGFSGDLDLFLIKKDRTLVMENNLFTDNAFTDIGLGRDLIHHI